MFVSILPPHFFKSLALAFRLGHLDRLSFALVYIYLLLPILQHLDRGITSSIFTVFSRLRRDTCWLVGWSRTLTRQQTD